MNDATHAELMSEMRQLCGSVRELTVELKHTQKHYENLDGRMSKSETDIRALQLDAALNKPILDIARAINTKMWLTILGSAVAVSASALDWSKFVGN